MFTTTFEVDGQTFFAPACLIFNGLFKQHGIRILFWEVSDQDSANIVIASANGTATVRNGSQNIQIAVNGAGHHRHTDPVINTLGRDFS